MDIYPITGATGFVGMAVINRLVSEQCLTVAAVKVKPPQSSTQCPVVEAGDLGSNTDWSVALIGIRSLGQVAARAHVMKNTSADPLAEFRRVNVAGTLNLAQQAAVAGVKRFQYD